MTLSVDRAAPAFLVKGDDEVLLENTVLELIQELIGDGDRSLMLEELDASAYERDNGDHQLSRLVDHAQTAPFLTERRVVVGRQLAVCSTADSVAALVAYLADPLPTTSLVLVWEKGPRPGSRLAKVPTTLTNALKRAKGVVIESSAGTGRARDQWVEHQLRDAPVKLDASARKLVGERIGEDAAMLVGLLPTLAAVYGTGARVTAADLEPYLGEAGAVKPFELTNAIDAGDVATALDMLHRLMDGGGWHPLQVMATLTNHYSRMLALDGSGVADQSGAAELLGIRGSTFPAKKALDQGRKLGTDRLAAFLALLAQADLDLRGAKAWPSELVVEVLVARLASRTPRGSARPARRPA
jgi:DNA polymerase-3 subunit delta